MERTIFLLFSFWLKIYKSEIIFIFFYVFNELLRKLLCMCRTHNYSILNCDFSFTTFWSCHTKIKNNVITTYIKFDEIRIL